MKIAHGADGSAVDASSANPLPVAVSGVATAAEQATGNATLTAIAGHVDGLEAATGAPAAAAAPADGTGDYSLIGAAKRALLNWATLLARIPALVSGRVPVDGSGVTQPVSIGATVAVSAAALPLPTGAATAGAQGAGNTSLASIDTKLPAAVTPGLLPVDTLATLGTARLVAMGAASANVALTAGARRVSIHATVAGFYAVGAGAQTATTSSHYIGAGERLDFDVAASSQIAALRGGSVDGVLYITELA
jgi:hypothetical protein